MSIVQKSKSLRRIRSTICLLPFVVTLAEAAAADTVVFRDGTKQSGTLANRDALAATPWAFKNISFLASELSKETSMQFLRIAVDKIEYVVLEDGETQRVVDFRMLKRRAKIPRNLPLDHHRSRDAGRQGMIAAALGTAMVAAGVFIPFGRKSKTAPQPLIPGPDKHYNGLNGMIIHSRFVAASTRWRI